MGKSIYAAIVDSATFTDRSEQARRNTAQQGYVNEPGAHAEAISRQPGSRTLSGTLRGKYSGEMRAELLELANATGFEAVAFYDTDAPSPTDGYYLLDSASQQPADPRFQNVYPFTMTLSRSGSRNSHWRAVAATLTAVDNPFATTDSALIGVPASAEKVRWYNHETTATQLASAAETQATEFGDVDRYELVSAPYDDAWVIYDLAYDQEGRTDPVVWDDHGRSREDADDIRLWQHVYDPEHVFSGDAVITNGHIRLIVDEGAGTVEAERWGDNSGWTSVSLTTTDWSLFDLDISLISPARVEARFLFTDGAELYELIGELSRGYADVLFHVPSNQSGGFPSGLDSWLGPIASDHQQSAAPTISLVPRQEVS